ncbi:flagellar motor protein MotS [Aliibacillus thermotolerans]|uniref:Flagellar motor protein MotS n=1 Tax=Aliibacillus thermotolerans TaxID=1834418 RepID=A0ABW0U9D4_9BACI|nr:flagellar motor protein MotS [Aliibacillus thermotolerans]MDA3129775.1 flagellar motor protein MotB [Aliibacillus thermotolerans]
MRRKKEKPHQKGSPAWMTTFADMVTLILVFFVMLFSMSVIDAQKFQAMVDSFQNRQVFEYFTSVVEFENPDSAGDSNDLELGGSGESDDGELDELLKEAEEYLYDNELSEYISATRDDRGVVLVLQEQLLFDTGEAYILDEAKPFLNKVGELLHNIPNMVKVEGHTDNRPISTFRYPSNWELSGARAGSVIRYLVENHQLDPERFIATGYGETRPIAPNDTPENLRKNRRVVIVITDPAFENQLTETIEETPSSTEP